MNNDNREFYTLIIGCNNNKSKANLWKLFFNKNSKTFTIPKEFDFLNNPSWLKADDNKLFVLEEISEKPPCKLYIYNINNDKRDIIIDLEGKDSCHFETYKREYAVSSYSGSCITYGNFSTGLQNKILFSGSGPVKERQEKSHPHSTLFSPCKNYLITADLGTDSLYIIDKKSLVYTIVDTKPGSGPRHMVFVESYLYIVNELDSTLSVFKWNNNNLIYITNISTRLENKNNVNYPSGIVYNSDKDCLYISNRGDNNIISVDIHIKEKPTILNAIVSGGNWPRTILLTPDNSYLIVLNQYSGNITAISIDDSGFLGRQLDSLKIDSPVGTVIY